MQRFERHHGGCLSGKSGLRLNEFLLPSELLYLIISPALYESGFPQHTGYVQDGRELQQVLES